MKRKWTILLLTAVAGFGLSGCGGATGAEEVDVEFSDLHPVTGTIDFNGQPIPDATVRLHPVQPSPDGSVVHPPSGLVDEEGRFEIHSYRPEGRGKGAPAGEYLISVRWSGPLQGLSESQLEELNERLPAKYTQPRSSGLTVTVTAGVNEVPPISLK